MKYQFRKWKLGVCPGIENHESTQSVSHAIGNPRGKAAGSATRSQTQPEHVLAW